LSRYGVRGEQNGSKAEQPFDLRYRKHERLLVFFWMSRTGTAAGLFRSRRNDFESADDRKRVMPGQREKDHNVISQGRYARSEFRQRCAVPPFTGRLAVFAKNALRRRNRGHGLAGCTWSTR
jgi:hypothetical protein